MIATDPVLRPLIRARIPAGPLVVDELGLLAGSGLADVAVIGDTWHGIEIKGATDSLARLSRQVPLYEAVFDTCELVTTVNHLDKALKAVPAPWAVTVAEPDGTGGLRLVGVRAASPQGAVSSFARAQLLWRDEALALLRAHDLGKGLASKPRHTLWTALAEAFTPVAIAPLVLQVLRAREGWLDETGQHRASTVQDRVDRAHAEAQRMERERALAARAAAWERRFPEESTAAV